MNAKVIACIVEGHGDVEAVPVLVRRIGESLAPTRTVTVPRPIRTPKYRLLKPGELERAAELARKKAGANGRLLVLIDSDADCPAELGPMILERLLKVAPDLPSAALLAKMEFETWFLAAAESLRGKRDLSGGLEAPRDPEAIVGAKEWLRERMSGSRTYSETLDQAALAAVFDLNQARRRSPSFEKCCREVVRLLT